MIPPQRLLVATDFSAGADCAASAAIALASRWNARIDWVHVSPEPSHALTPSSDTLMTRYVEHEHHESRDGLAALQKRASEQGVESDVHRIDGRPHVALADFAEQQGSDWVVVGAHGRSGIQSVLIGSVAEKVVRTSPVTALSVRPGPALAGGTIIFGEDFGSPTTRKAAAALAQALEARLLAVHSVELAASVMANATFSPPPALIDSSVAEARERLEALSSEYADGAESSVALGSASGALCDAARRHNASLVVCGTASRKGLERWMLGSVAERTLRHAPCSVLILK